MKRTLALTLCLALALPGIAHGERLTEAITQDFQVDAPLPAHLPDTLPHLSGAPLPMDVDAIIAQLMPDAKASDIVDTGRGSITVGEGDGESEYMLIETDVGRISYNTAYVNQYLRELMPAPGHIAQSYLPKNLPLSFLTPEEAIQACVDFLAALGIQADGETATLYTLSLETVAPMQEAMEASEYLHAIQRKWALRAIAPFDPAHEGYFITLSPTVGGLPYLYNQCMQTAQFYISAMGMEMVDTGYCLLAMPGETAPLLPMEDALLAAAKANPSMLREGTSCTIEEIMLCYSYDWETEALSPCYLFRYCTAGAGAMETRTFSDPYVFLYGMLVDAQTGRVSDQTIF